MKKTVSLKPVYYIYGAEDYLIDQAVRDIKSRALTPGMESLNYQVYEAASLDPYEVITSAETLPAMSERRVVWIKRAEGLKPEAKQKFLEYIENPSPSTCVVFTAHTAKPDKRTAFFKALNSKGYAIEHKLKYEREVREWIHTEVTRQRKTISDEAVTRLIDIGGRKLNDIKGELEKIILFIGQRGRVEVGDVEDVGLDVKERSVFDLASAIAKKDLASALTLFAKVSSNPPLMVLGAITRQFRTLLKIKGHLRTSTPKSKIGPLVGVPPYFLDGYLSICKHYTEPGILGVLKSLSRVDMALKSSPLTPDVIMTGLIMELCSAPAARSRA